MKLSEGAFSVDGTPDPAGVSVRLFVDSWAGAPGSGRVMLIVHGLGEHGGRYRHFGDRLKSECERFYAMDQRGHGRSGGTRGDAPTFDHLVEDVKRVAAEVARREPGKEIDLVAHSFGGLVALRLLLNVRKSLFKRAVISAPLLGILLRVPGHKKLLGEILGRTLPRIQISNEVNPGHLSHDLAVVEAYTKDRLVHSKITPRLYLELKAAMEWVRSQTRALACPTLFIVPGDDRLVDAKATLAFFRGIKSRDKFLREYPGFFHEAFNELNSDLVFADLKNWLKGELQ